MHSMFYFLRLPFLRRWAPWLLLACILAGAGILLVEGALHDAPVMDEQAHIPAGYAMDRFLDYRLNPEHPPLEKALAALPLLFMQVSFPVDSAHWQAVNDQWALGKDFLFHAGNDAQEITVVARIFPILLTLFLIFFVYWWARTIMGPWWALMPAFFTAYTPDVLAYGHYVITDVGAALGFLVGLYFFVMMLKSPTRKRVIFAGIFFGVAQLLKFSTLFLVPLFVIMTAAYWWAHARKDHVPLLSRNSLRALGVWMRRVLAVLGIGFLIVFVVYVFFTWGYPIKKQMTDTASILSPLLNGQTGMAALAAHTDVWMASVPFLRGPAQYLLGLIMNIERYMGTSSAYFLGMEATKGWWFYFPILFMTKEPIPSLLFVYVGVALALSAVTKRKSTSFMRRIEICIVEHTGICVMALTVFLYWTASIASTLNIGLRHVLPTIPLLFICAAWMARKWFEASPVAPVAGVHAPLAAYGRGAKVVFMLFLAAWLGAEVAATYPYYLSYFNEFAGGVTRGYLIAGDSNYDWGQDLLRLKTALDTPPLAQEIQPGEKIAVDYFGGGDVVTYLGSRAVPWTAAQGNPASKGIHWFIGSIQNIELARLSPNASHAYGADKHYQWLNHPYEPYAKAGTSIFIYRLQ